MTALDLALIEARAAAATEGPWFAYDRGCGWEIYLDEHGDRYGHKSNGDWARQLPEGAKTDIGNATDALFIAHARTDVPALLAEVRRLRAELESALTSGPSRAVPPTGPGRDYPIFPQPQT